MQQCWRYKRGWPVDSFLIHLLEFNRKSWLKSGRSTPFTTFTIVPLEHFLQNIWITDSFQVGRPSCVTMFIGREKYNIIGTDNMKVAAGKYKYVKALLEYTCLWHSIHDFHLYSAPKFGHLLWFSFHFLATCSITCEIYIISDSTLPI